MFLLKDTTQWRRWGSNPRPFGLESSTLPLSHCAPCLHAGVVCGAGNCTHSVCHYQAWVLCHPDPVWHMSALTWLQPLFTLFSLFFILKIAKYAKSYPDFPNHTIGASSFSIKRQKLGVFILLSVLSKQGIRWSIVVARRQILVYAAGTWQEVNMR